MNKETLRYLAGVAGPSGYGSKSTADQVTQHHSSSFSLHNSHHILTAIVTGATSGIGAETARVLAKRGVRIVIPARNLKKATEVRESIQKEIPKAEILLMEIDLSSFASVKRFCSEFLSLGLPLNILINNAGKFSQKLEFSEDKIEMTFATNYLDIWWGLISNTMMLFVHHIYAPYDAAPYMAPTTLLNWVHKTRDWIKYGHFLLTELLLEKMIETAAHTGVEGRIINVSSVIHSWVEREEAFCFTQILNPNNYNGTRAYAQSKLASILHAKEMATHLKARNARVTINAVHPGIVKTGIIREHKGLITDSLFFLASKLLKTTSQGASTTCYVALSPQTEGVSGKYFADCNESNCSSLANDESLAHGLWNQTRALIRNRLRQSVA